MFIFDCCHNIIARRLYRRVIAMTLLLVMVTLAGTACCYELAPEQEKYLIKLTAGADAVDHDDCPLCPSQQDAAAGDCSACADCSCKAPIILASSASYYPSIAKFIIGDFFTRLPEVHLPIFVPPENIV